MSYRIRLGMILPAATAVVSYFAAPSLAQVYTSSDGILHDSSYTSYSAARKIHKKFPQVRLVPSSLPKGVVERSNIVYTTYGTRELHLDVFMPSAESKIKYPGVLVIHGGGWVSGERSMLVPMAEQLAKNGFIAVTAEYRLGPEALYPAAVYDLKAAIRWMRAVGPDYGIDTNKIAVYGCSAGGELAAFLGTTGGLSKYEGKGGYAGHSTRIEAVVNVDGLLDFTNVNSTRYDTNPAKPSAAHRWFGGSYKEIPQVWKDASPVSYVGPNTPPVIFINSSMKHYHAGRDEMIKALKKYGVKYEVRTVAGTPHTFWLFDPWFAKTLGYTVAFLDAVFKSGEAQRG